MRIRAYTKRVTDVVPASNGPTGLSDGLTRWDLYRVLAEPIRLRLLALATEEELAVGELAELLGESQPNVSRHAAALRLAGLLTMRKDGTRALLKLRDDAAVDAVVADAIGSGRGLCEADGSLARIAELVRAREAASREFFARARTTPPLGPPAELGAYLMALAPLLPRRALAVDAGTGDGGLIEVLAPVYDRVVGIDRSDAQLDRARERVDARGFQNVSLVRGEIDAPEVIAAVGAGADAVFASRLVHHAPRPDQFVKQLVDLLAVGGSLVVLEYAPHEDESMREQADVWLGFDPAQLRRFARGAGLDDIRVSQIPAARCGRGPDSQLRWQLLVGTKKERNGPSNGRGKNGAKHG
jgi:DNA-binding transcriptional ArsR family regulator/SAM-dependent methyltransferase